MCAIKEKQIPFAIENNCVKYYDGSYNNSPNVNLEEGIEEIGTLAFAYCDIENIHLPSTLKTIRSHAFYQCMNLSSLVLNDGLKKIEERAFQECYRIHEVTIPATVEVIENNAFSSTLLRKVFLKNPNTAYAKDSFPRDCKVILE